MTCIALAMSFALSAPLRAATITVDETTCTLADAINAANSDGVVGGCAAGSGADIIELTTNVTVAAPLPSIMTEIAIAGGGFSIDALDPEVEMDML